MSDATLLVELLTEELPPKSLRQLSESFAEEVNSELIKHRLRNHDPRKHVFATPRRLAVAIEKVRATGLDSESLIDGPVSTNAKAVEGFARKHGIAVDALQRRQTSKGEIVVANVKHTGVTLEAALAGIVEKALKKLPIPKVMRWGAGEAQFVRPAHGLVMLHGPRVIPGEVLGLKSGNKTLGHRFMGKGEIVLANAEDYEKKLLEGSVVASFDKREAEIDKQLQGKAKELSSGLGEHQALLDEVAALVEFPCVYVGEFDTAFLAMPQECLILTMRQNQKYFPLFDAAGKLTGKFLIVANMKVADPRHIVGGNQRVVRPRLEDARFFYDQDRKTRLEERVPLLARVVYHNKLGSQRDRVERLQLLAGHVARAIGADVADAERAAWLSKADLLTGMVGEFPELQGLMGSYYAGHDGESKRVCEAIADQYRLRFSDSANPENLVSAAVYLADRIDLLIGFFGIGQIPTGEKDPFALRRAALGVISVVQLVGESSLLVGRRFPDLGEILKHSVAQFSFADANAVAEKVYDFILERYWNSLATVFPKTSVEAVFSLRPKIDEIIARLQAVEEFRKLPEAESLAAANKRIRNIMRQAKFSFDAVASTKLLSESAEKDLYREIVNVRGSIESKSAARDYTEALCALAALRPLVDHFFDKVMVNSDDQALRINRLRILGELDHMMNQVADISMLAV